MQRKMCQVSTWDGITFSIPVPVQKGDVLGIYHFQPINEADSIIYYQEYSGPINYRSNSKKTGYNVYPLVFCSVSWVNVQYAKKWISFPILLYRYSFKLYVIIGNNVQWFKALSIKSYCSSYYIRYRLCSFSSQFNIGDSLIHSYIRYLYIQNSTYICVI